MRWCLLLLAVACGCRQNTIHKSVNRQALSTRENDSFAREESLVKEKILEETAGKRIEFIKWGPHYRLSEAELARLPSGRPSAHVTLRVVWRLPEEDRQNRLQDYFFGFRDGVAWKGSRNPLGDDWLRIMKQRDICDR